MAAFDIPCVRKTGRTACFKLSPISDRPWRSTWGRRRR